MRRSSSPDMIALRLLQSHEQAQRRRVRVCFVSAGVGSVLMATGMVLWWKFFNFVAALGVLLGMIGFCLTSNAVLPTDVRSIRALVLCFTLGAFIIAGRSANTALITDNSLLANPEPCYNSTLPNVMTFCVVQTAKVRRCQHTRASRDVRRPPLPPPHLALRCLFLKPHAATLAHARPP
jgi:hypothetical protein